MKVQGGRQEDRWRAHVEPCATATTKSTGHRGGRSALLLVRVAVDRDGLV
jgi:hypothetical protein